MASDYGGGICYSALDNCIVYYNTASNAADYFNSALDHCCVNPDPGG